MRIACIYVPQFGLQAAVRLDPSLRGKAAAVVGMRDVERVGAHLAPVVVSCSRAAWDLGVRLGMAGAAARSRSPGVVVVTADREIERDAMHAVGDVLRGLAETVDFGGRVGATGAHLAMYAKVPSSVRGTTFGNRVVDHLKRIGFTCRVGIADDRFTAQIAASHHRGMVDRVGESRWVTNVPRGGSAAFLAPLPLMLLPIPLEVQHMLESLGVRTLGEFAALPAPSTAVRSASGDTDFQSFAKGEGGATLRAQVSDRPICEEMMVGSGNVLDATESLSAPTVVAQLARRVALRLEGRGTVATRLQLTVKAGASTRVVDVVPGQPLFEAESLAGAFASAVGEGSAGEWKLRVQVVGEQASTRTDPAHARLPDSVARLPSEDRGEAETQASVALAAATSTVEPLALVLSTSGALLSLSAQRGRRYRRARRGKQRSFVLSPAVQSRLWEQGR